MATVPLVDAPSSRRADNSYDVDAGREVRRARRQRRRRDNTLASPRRTIRALAAVGVGATVCVSGAVEPRSAEYAYSGNRTEMDGESY